MVMMTMIDGKNSGSFFFFWNGSLIWLQGKYVWRLNLP